MKIYICSIREFLDLPFINKLSQNRIDKINDFVFLEDKARSLVAGLLLKYALGFKYDKIKISKYGKPYLPDKELYFNLTHSKDYVALVIDSFEVGIDIEYHEEVDQNIIDIVFVKDEISWLNNQNDKNMFYKLWTGKESFMKMKGFGFSMPPNTFSISSPFDGEHIINETKCFMKWYDLNKYSLCVSSINKNDVDLVYINRKMIEEYFR